MSNPTPDFSPGWQGHEVPKKKSKKPLVIGIVGAALALCCGGVSVVALNSDSGKKGLSDGMDTASTTPAKPSATSKASTKPNPDVKTTPAKPVGPRTLLTVKGSGIKSTKKFTTDDEWQLKYTFDCSNFGSEGNFQIYDFVDGDMSDVLTNELAKKGTDTIPVYSPGEHYLKINSQCKWTVTVTE